MRLVLILCVVLVGLRKECTVISYPVQQHNSLSNILATSSYPFRISAVVADENVVTGRPHTADHLQLYPKKLPGRKNTYNQSHEFRKWLNKTRENYDSRLRPFFGGVTSRFQYACWPINFPIAEKPLVIKLGMFLIGISSISEASMEFTAELFFHETWIDERLKFSQKDFGTDTLTLPLDAPAWLWLPDTSFLNALRSVGPRQGSVSHLYYMRLSHNGSIQYSRRLSVTAECQMDLTISYTLYNVLFALDGFTKEDVIYNWALYSNSIPEKIQLQDFYSTDHSANIFTKEYVAGKFSVPTFCIVFTRRSGFCFIQLFVPATAVVASSWISLWLQSETQFADMVSIILAIIFLSYSYNTVMPKVSYVKAMDIYLIACFIFAFLSLVKLAIVKYMHNKVNKRRQKLRAASASLLHLPSLFEDFVETVALTTNANRKPDHAEHSHDRTPSLPVLRSAAASAPVPPPPSEAYKDTYWRCMRAFHVGSQLFLPFAFAAFCIFYFFIYPQVQTNTGVCK